MPIQNILAYRGEIMNEIGQIIGERIKQLRKERGWSQEELAHRANINRTYIGELERGEKNATIDSLAKVVNALETTFEELFRYIQPSSENKDNNILPVLINRLNALSFEEQKVMLDLFEFLAQWKKIK